MPQEGRAPHVERVHLGEGPAGRRGAGPELGAAEVGQDRAQVLHLGDVGRKDAPREAGHQLVRVHLAEVAEGRARPRTWRPPPAWPRCLASRLSQRPAPAPSTLLGTGAKAACVKKYRYCRSRQAKRAEKPGGGSDTTPGRDVGRQEPVQRLAVLDLVCCRERPRLLLLLSLGVLLLSREPRRLPRRVRGLTMPSACAAACCCAPAARQPGRRHSRPGRSGRISSTRRC